MKKVRVWDKDRKKWFDARICPICGGHEPVTKKVTEEECCGHVGLRDHFQPF